MQHPFSIRIFLAVLAFTLSIASLTHAADPKIVRASHEVVTTSLPQDSTGVPQQNSSHDELAYTPQWPEPPNTGAMLMRLGIGTVVVLVLCVGSLWAAKPWLQRLQVGNTGTRALTIEGSITLGNRAMLYLVRVGDTQLVAGTDAGGLKSLIAIPASFKDALDEQVSPEGDVESNRNRENNFSISNSSTDNRVPELPVRSL